MSTPDLAYIAFALMTLALVTCLIYISHLRHQKSELYTMALAQDALLDVYVKHTQDNDEYVRELSILLKAAYESADEYRAALRRIDDMLQTDPIQFLVTTEESHHV